MQETQETLAWSLGWEGPLEKEMATHSYSMDRGAQWSIVHRVAESRTQLKRLNIAQLSTAQNIPLLLIFCAMEWLQI